MGLGRKPQASNDWKSIEILRDNGGDFPTLDSALDYLAGLTFTPTLSDKFEIKLGVGNFPVTNTSVITLPDFVVITGKGPGATRITGTTAGPLFEADAALFQGITFAGCTSAVNRISATSGLINLIDCELLSDSTTLLTTSGGLNLVQRCNANGITGPFVDCTGGTIVGVLNCSLSLFDSGATYLRHGGGFMSVRNCVLDASLVSGSTVGFDINGNASFAYEVESSNNVYNNFDTGITIADEANLTVFSKGEIVKNVTTNALVIEGAAGTNSATYNVTDFTADPATFALNGNMPPLNVLDVGDSTNFNSHKWEDLTGGTVTLDHTHKHVLVDDTVTLPLVAIFTFWQYKIKNDDTAVITVDANGSETFSNGALALTLQPGEIVTIQSDGTVWQILGRSQETITRTARFGVSNLQKGATAPTDVLIGTTPSVGALLFDAVAELVSFNFIPPEDMDLTVDFTIDIHFALITGQTNLDVAAGTIDYIAYDSANNEVLTKTSTQITATETITTAGGVAQDTSYVMQFTVDVSDATNPIDSLVNGQADFEFHLTNVSPVTGIHVTGAHVIYTALY
jgi:hypothetical protein